ncbi:MAG: hypothetical protein HFH36_05635 [Lachnospiraceae bacterium]|nr:hypothetical protein [Lachnospiraceae bacterium]
MLRNILSAGLINLLVTGVDMARYRDKKRMQKDKWEEASVSSFYSCARGNIPYFGTLQIPCPAIMDGLELKNR